MKKKKKNMSGGPTSDAFFQTKLQNFVRFADEVVPDDVQQQMFEKLMDSKLYELLGSPARFSDVEVATVIPLFAVTACVLRQKTVDQMSSDDQALFRAFLSEPSEEGCNRLHEIVMTLVSVPELKAVYEAFSTLEQRTKLFRYLSFFIAVVETE